MTTRETIDRYYACWRGDFGQFRDVLTEDFRFRGAMDSADGPDAFIALTRRDAPMFKGAEFVEPRELVDGNRLVRLYGFRVGGVTVPMAEAFEVRGDRISRIDLYFDPSPFRRA